MRLPRFLGLVVILFAATGCRAAMRDNLRTRAAFELDCPAEKLTLTELGGFTTQGVSGCDRKAVYVLNHNNQWLLNSDAERSAQK